MNETSTEAYPSGERRLLLISAMPDTGRHDGRGAIGVRLPRSGHQGSGCEASAVA
jgi:hypothetical protein